MSKSEQIKKLVEVYSEKASGKLGLGYYDLVSGDSVYYNGDEIFPTASVFKIFILAELYRQISNGTFNLDDRYEVKEEFQSIGSGVLANTRAGLRPTVYDYALLMMIISDNTSADFLYNMVGKENIRKNVLDALELKNSKADLTCADLIFKYGEFREGQTFEEMMDQYYHKDYRGTDWFACRKENNNQSTPEDMIKMMKVIYDGGWVNKDISNQMLKIMLQCQTDSRIPKYLPAGTKVAHKTGSFDRIGNDVGIVYTKSGNYILALFYNGNLANEDEYKGKNAQGYFGDELLAHLSKDIFDIYTSEVK